MKKGYGFTEFETIQEFANYMNNLKVTRKITKLQVHHMALPDYSCWAKDNALRRQYNTKWFHINTNKWDDIAQQLSIFPNGHIVTGRSFNKMPIGIKGWNTGAVCIEIYGNFDKDVMTEAQANAVIACYAILAHKFKLSINSTNIKPHCWFTAGGAYIGDYNRSRSCKTCPGLRFFGGNTKSVMEKNFYPKIRAYDIKNLQQGTVKNDEIDIVNFKVKVITDSLNVRTGPGTNYNKKISVSKNEIYNITKVNSAGTWGLAKELDGWMCITEDYVERVQPAATKEFMIKILADELNIRTGPGTQYGSVGMLKKNEAYTIVEVNSQGTWGKLKSGAGWISLNDKYVKKVEVMVPQPPKAPENKFIIKVKVKELNVRKGPGVEYDVVEKIFEGGAFTIVEKNKEGTWGKLLSGIGWINISSDYVNIVK
jgi:uncharacterized protein YgiM (DUF1202 family)